jgi:ribosomal protein S18 acetylase RimI-like enzyme
MSHALTLRRATRADAVTLADIHMSSRAAAMPWLRVVHTAEETRWWMTQVVVPRLEVWVAERAGAALGFLALQDEWVEQLYVDPGGWRMGAGSMLLDHAKQRRPKGLKLWTFQRNALARAFYRKHGFVEIRETDGSANEEREPDVMLQWRA